MPFKHQHSAVFYQQAARNLRILNDVNGSVDNSIDWQITIAFYVAVLLMKSHCAECGHDPVRHYEIEGYIEGTADNCNNSELPISVTDAYAKMSEYSRKARYVFPFGVSARGKNTPPVLGENELIEVLSRLDLILADFKERHDQTFRKIKIHFSQFKPTLILDYFEFVHRPKAAKALAATGTAVS